MLYMTSLYIKIMAVCAVQTGFMFLGNDEQGKTSREIEKFEGESAQSGC